jgi:uncharacterized protein YkwD
MIKRFFLVLLVPIFLASLVNIQAVQSQEVTPTANPEADAQALQVTDEVVVTIAPDASFEAVTAEYQAQGCQVVDSIPALRRLVVTCPVSQSANDEVAMQSALTALEAVPGATDAEPNGIYQISYTPNDPGVSQQNAAWDPIDAYEAWDVTRGSSNVVIAIIDTGIQADHPDLDAQQVAGYDFVQNDNNPSDGNGHGTHVAGTSAAETGNATGGAGLCPNCRLMAVRALNDGGSGSLSNIAKAIIYATNNGAKVINMSLGGSGSSTLRDAVDYAWNKGVFLACAAGNSNSSRAQYPAAYDNCFSVAATDANDNRASFSNYGSTVDIAAPGVRIYSTYTGSRYGQLSGTSMAAPHVAGLAGLLSSQGLTNAQIRERIGSTADKINGAGTLWANGRINANRAVRGGGSTSPPPTATLAPDTPVPTATPNPGGQNEAQKLVELINQQRSANNLRPLAANAQLTQAAQVHTTDMATNNFLSHTGSDGSTTAQRVERAGYKAQAAEQIVARTYTSADEMSRVIMGQSSLRSRVLNANYIDIGIANVRSGSGTPYWTIVVAAPANGTQQPTATATQPSQPGGKLRIEGVREGQTINGSVAIQAFVDTKSVEQIAFALRGPSGFKQDHVEKRTPYYFMGNDPKGKPYGWDSRKAPNGDYTLSVIATGANLRAEQVVRFKVNNGGAGAPTPTTAPKPTTAPTTSPVGGIKPDPNFRGPFCEAGSDGDPVIIGFDKTDTIKQPTDQEVIDYHLKAVNFIRSRTGLPALKYNTKLGEIAQQAQAANNGHGYFIQNCMNSRYGYGATCAVVGEENGVNIRWKQENIGGASGTRRSWQDGIRVPLCAMMAEEYGTGHRANIEHKKYTHIGFSHKMSANGGMWFHEFGGPGDTRLDK